MDVFYWFSCIRTFVKIAYWACFVSGSAGSCRDGHALAVSIVVLEASFIVC